MHSAMLGTYGLEEETVTMEIRHVLAPTDFSEFSLRAIEYAFAWAVKFRAKLLLLHVVELPAYSMQPYTTADLIPALLEELEREATMQLAQLLPDPGAANIEVTRCVEVGVPYEKIIETAAHEQVDLIVMATHGRTGLSHFIMGSVAERVVHLAPCPVLTMRATA